MIQLQLDVGCRLKKSSESFRTSEKEKVLQYCNDFLLYLYLLILSREMWLVSLFYFTFSSKFLKNSCLVQYAEGALPSMHHKSSLSEKLLIDLMV